MAVIRTWLLGVIAAAAAISIVNALLPKGRIAAVARCSGGIFLLLMVLRPILSADASGLYRTYADWEAELSAQTEVRYRDQTETLAGIIEEKTAAYIQRKAEGLGVACTAEVTCRLRSGVPFPAEVTLHTAYNAKLEEIIAEELAIPAQCQHWEEGGA